MPTIQDLNTKFAQLRAAIVAKLPDIAATLAVSAKAISERHILEQGFGRTYSDNRLPYYYLEGKELNASGILYLQKKKKSDALKTHTQNGVKFYPADYGVNWKEFRNAQGLPTDHVDLHYSNRMFSNMQPVKFISNSDGSYVQALLGATNVEDQLKMDYNRDRYGDFIRQTITSEDDKVLQQIVADEFNQVLLTVNI